MQSNRNLHTVQVGRQNDTATLEDSFPISYKVTYCVKILSSHCSLRYLPNWVEIIHLHRNLHTNVYSSFIYYHQNLEATTLSFVNG